MSQSSSRMPLWRHPFVFVLDYICLSLSTLLNFANPCLFLPLCISLHASRHFYLSWLSSFHPFSTSLSLPLSPSRSALLVLLPYGREAARQTPRQQVTGADLRPIVSTVTHYQAKTKIMNASTLGNRSFCYSISSCEFYKETTLVTNHLVTIWYNTLPISM